MQYDPKRWADLTNHPNKQLCVEHLKAIQPHTTIPLCIAGGIKLSNIDNIIKAQPHTIIVGGEITASKHPQTTAKAIKEMMQLQVADHLVSMIATNIRKIINIHLYNHLDKENALLQRPVAMLGLMPALPLGEETLTKIATYIYEEQFSRPCEHWKNMIDNAEKKGKMNAKSLT